MTAAELPELIQGFESDPVLAGKRLRELLAADVPTFLQCALAVLRAPNGSRVQRYLLALLHGEGLLLRVLADRSVGAAEAAVLARTARSIDNQFDVAMARMLGQGGLDDASMARLLPVLDELVESPGAAAALAPLLVHHNPRIRSKAALLIGKGQPGARWVEKQLSAADARVRANAIEALWHKDGERCRPVFREAARDPNNRVAGNAMVGLYFLGDPESVKMLHELAVRPAPDFLPTAAWCMGETEDPRFLPMLNRMLAGSTGRTRQNVLRAIARIRQYVARAEQAGRLHVHLFDAARSEPWTGRLRLTVFGMEAAGLAALKGTHFILTENGHPVMDYQVANVLTPEVLLVGFALPRRSGSEDPLRGTLKACMLECAPYRRKGDSWGVAHYGSGEPQPGDPPRFSADDSLLSGGNPGPRYRGWVETLGGLMRAASVTRGARHLILVADPGEQDGGAGAETAAIEELASKAALARVAVHTVPVGAAAYWTMCWLAGATKGRFVPAATPEEIPAACQKICLGLLHQFTISYKSGVPATEAAELRLQVHSIYGIGEDSCTLTPVDPA